MVVLEVDEGLNLALESSNPFSNDFSESDLSELKLAGEILRELIRLFLDMVFRGVAAVVLFTYSHNIEFLKGYEKRVVLMGYGTA